MARVDLQSGMTYLDLDSAEGKPIDNIQTHEISDFESAQFRLYDKWGPTNEIRTNPMGRYNCHGLTFGGRRTQISTEAVNQILREDGYVEVPSTELKPGDAIIYWGPDGDATHSGIVVEKDMGLGIPRIVSKWGKYAEILHPANQCPYDFQAARYYRVKP